MAMHRDMTSMNMCSEIFCAPLAQDVVRPCNDDSWRGRFSHDAHGFVRLPRTMPVHYRLFILPFPSSQPTSALQRGCEHIDPCPDFSGRTALEMLMGPQVIVDGSNMLQSSVTRRGIVNGVLHKQSFHRADEPLDTAVLPRASRIAVLQADTQEAQNQTKTPRCEDGFVVGTQELGVAILTAHGDEVMPNRQRRFIRQSLYEQARATGMIHDGQHDMSAAVSIGRCQQVHGPNQIAGDGPGHAMFQFSSQTQDGVLLASNCVGDVGFADRHVPTRGPAAIETVRDRAAARVGHEGFETNDLVSHPTRFGRRMRSAHWPTGSVAWPEGATGASQPAAQQSAQPGAPANEPVPQSQHHDPLLFPLCMRWVEMC